MTTPNPSPVLASQPGTGKEPSASCHIRIARPSHDIAKIEQFYVQGLGLKVLSRLGNDATGGHALLMLGWPGAAWHLEIVDDAEKKFRIAPTEEDLLVIYVDGPIDPVVVERLIAAGGTRVTALNPYWEQWGVTLADPDGYRLVLSQRGWENKA